MGRGGGLGSGWHCVLEQKPPPSLVRWHTLYLLLGPWLAQERRLHSFLAHGSEACRGRPGTTTNSLHAQGSQEVDWGIHSGRHALTRPGPRQLQGLCTGIECEPWSLPQRKSKSTQAASGPSLGPSLPVMMWQGSDSPPSRLKKQG